MTLLFQATKVFLTESLSKKTYLFSDMEELIAEVFRQNGKTTMLIDHVRDYLALKIHRNGSLFK